MQEALADALRRLKHTEKTSAELRAALLTRYSPEATEAALVWLRSRSLLSDDRAVEATVLSRTTGRRAESDQRLRQRLEAKGADEVAIQMGLAGIPDEAARMQDALNARFRPEENERAKAGRFLLSRGFDEEAVESALDLFFTGE